MPLRKMKKQKAGGKKSPRLMNKVRLGQRAKKPKRKPVSTIPVSGRLLRRFSTGIHTIPASIIEGAEEI